MYIVQCTRTILYMYKIVHVQIIHVQIVNVKIVHDAMQSGQSLTAAVNISGLAVVQYIGQIVRETV